MSVEEEFLLGTPGKEWLDKLCCWAYMPMRVVGEVVYEMSRLHHSLSVPPFKNLKKGRLKELTENRTNAFF